MLSKSKIDRSGEILSSTKREYDEISLELDYVFEDYRKNHLEPLTRLTLILQEWLQTYGKEYYIAQRLKRKPQILRKLRRFSVRLTQLQDIGGCRIIVDKNNDVDTLISFLFDKFKENSSFSIFRSTDYREFGRDDTGYRAYHVVINISGYKIELQIRSKIQHYWSESIERTSVIYGNRLKESEGDSRVISYFKLFSNHLHKIESKLPISSSDEIQLQKMRTIAETVITEASDEKGLGGHVNEDIVKTMADFETQNKEELNNWILVFDWSDGNFVTWDVVGRNTDEATFKYRQYERQFPEEEKYEVVMIGSSDIKSVKQTHSHYFGIEHHNSALEDMESSIIGLSKRNELDVGARRILFTLKRRKYWGKNSISLSTLKNHFCQNVATFDVSLSALRQRGFISGDDPISLNSSRAKEINSFA